jgi:hypothetical protein
MTCVDHGGANPRYTIVYTEGKRVGAHRKAYADAAGVPLSSLDGMVVMHTCDNPRCINPDHLKLGTQKDNLQDMKDKGRKHYVITKEKALAIREAEGTQRGLASEFGVSKTLVGMIKRGEIWV